VLWRVPNPTTVNGFRVFTSALERARIEDFRWYDLWHIGPHRLVMCGVEKLSQGRHPRARDGAAAVFPLPRRRPVRHDCGLHRLLVHGGRLGLLGRALQPILLRRRLAAGVQRLAVAGDSRHCRRARGAAGSGRSESVAKAGGDDWLRARTAAEQVPVDQSAHVPASARARAAVGNGQGGAWVTGPRVGDRLPVDCEAEGRRVCPPSPPN
jgi:hypothetical protein